MFYATYRNRLRPSIKCTMRKKKLILIIENFSVSRIATITNLYLLSSDSFAVIYAEKYSH